MKDAVPEKLGNLHGIQRRALAKIVGYAPAGLRSRLADAGVPIIDDEPLPGFSRFYVEDPFGNRIELLAPD